MSQKAVVLTVFLIAIVVVTPLAYSVSVFYALGRLQWHIPTLTVSRDELDIYVTLNFKVSNPTFVPLPTLEAIIEVTLDGNGLFYGESHQIGSLNPHSSAGYERIIDSLMITNQKRSIAHLCYGCT